MFYPFVLFLQNYLWFFSAFKKKRKRPRNRTMSSQKKGHSNSGKEVCLSKFAVQFAEEEAVETFEVSHLYYFLNFIFLSHSFKRCAFDFIYCNGHCQDPNYNVRRDIMSGQSCNIHSFSVGLFLVFPVLHFFFFPVPFSQQKKNEKKEDENTETSFSSFSLSFSFSCFPFFDFFPFTLPFCLKQLN